jgi:hypothetical protein
MPMEVTAYQAKDGTLHANACEAATIDLKLIIAASPLAENRPYADKVLEWLTSDPEGICDALGAYADACPKNSRDEGTSEAGEGPVVSQDPNGGKRKAISVLNGDGEPMQIPELVYWHGENANFYDAINRKGMGQAFYDEWRSVARFFPKYPEDASHAANHEGPHDFRDQGEKHGD